jgi:hypothetical protein
MCVQNQGKLCLDAHTSVRRKTFAPQKTLFLILQLPVPV